jgi:hypothetical protein
MTFDFAGSLNEPIHAGQLIDIAAVPATDVRQPRQR